MTTEITAQTGAVIELGPGTGVFTQALLDRGVAESDLVLVESSTAFADALSLRYPAATMLRMDAAHLRRIELETAKPIGAVVSGLPLLSMHCGKCSPSSKARSCAFVTTDASISSPMV